MTIESLTLYRLSVPLTTPYRLSFGPVRAFDTLIVAMSDDAGNQGFGEATYLTGYTDETLQNGWDLAQRIARTAAGSACSTLLQAVAPHYEAAPFTATAFATALDMLRRHPLLEITEAVEVPVLGLLHATETADIEHESEALLAKGFRTFKVKVGFDAAHDSALVKRIQQVLGERVKIRLDANQGYSRSDACAFASSLVPEGIELFEQPCAAHDWESACAVARVSSVPMMLDESIYGVDDIRRAADLKAARFIKLKLMKLGSLDRLVAALHVIGECGMEPVLGNGVACEIGCWMEACVARSHIGNAGEMNGFLKPQSALLSNPLMLRDGSIALEPGYRPRLDPEALARYTLERLTFAAPH